MARISKAETEKKATEIKEESVEKTETKVEAKVETKTKAEIKRELKKKASSIDVEVMNLTCGSFTLINGLDSIYIENEGDTTIVGLDLLLKIKNQKSMKNLFISVVDVFSDEFKLEDVVEILGLEHIYKDRVLTLDFIDDFLINSTLEEFSEVFKTEPIEYKQLLSKRAISLAYKNKFDSMSKRAIVQELLGNPYVFKVS